ncbi:hypothetical protein SAMN06265222_108191 [Neorhodopirellula lusitana]|uniref:Uncharacterized protein n=1 Tax=Neorhodopirellula lusitana TaxID=445327 RepID=A0ABY1Q9G8_9BACT|nr:hypothetical protein SAMN06265222_108191 [Neorhodopirellula lusitana]
MKRSLCMLNMLLPAVLMPAILVPAILMLAILVPTVLVPSVAKAEGGRTVARIFWQEDADASLRWGDLKKSGKEYSIEEQGVDGFPELDASDQSLVQMVSDEGVILVGVRDQADGTIGSGWVALNSGLTEEPHGDHSHWRYTSAPQVLTQLIDTNQGNPAHVYHYGKSFVMANDQKNGFTILTAASILGAGEPSQAQAFSEGGSDHITLAVVENKVAYATWISYQGEDSGRVDVVGLAENAGKKYSFRCPTGGLHGAIVNQGKAFFAPADGVCWVDVDLEVDDDPDAVEVHYLSLGTADAEVAENAKSLTSTEGVAGGAQAPKPLRTGAFKALGKYVLCNAGKGEQSKLCIIDASADQPGLIEVPLNVRQDQSVSSSMVFSSASQGPLALMFAESKEKPETDQLWIAELDPNLDGDFSDAQVRAPIAVGPSKLGQHTGHHGAAVLPDGRHIAITNPGSASIWILSLSNSSVIAKLKVEGTPTRLLVQPQG